MPNLSNTTQSNTYIFSLLSNIAAIKRTHKHDFPIRLKKRVKIQIDMIIVFPICQFYYPINFAFSASTSAIVKIKLHSGMLQIITKNLDWVIHSKITIYIIQEMIQIQMSGTKISYFSFIIINLARQTSPTKSKLSNCSF